ncbi:MAG: 4-(cytidine 5'-diphospho)-2-C-methyl-D-erythritol kinase [Defluviitaleaceae bacterium]|nr:4-(cytidine 5'-diphospho)-2-C-methyl-D-erythritol kinase [Defluviitaleaceae bacterium]
MNRLAQTAQGCDLPLENPRHSAGGFRDIRAYAKINLFLDVLAKREDSYHDIFSVMQTVSLCDDIHIKRVAPCEGEQIRLTCNDPTLPTDKQNLVVRAANALVRTSGIRDGIDINLTKRIPAGAGLAGGSSDCAATLSGINELFDLKIPHEQLMKIAKSLGADVPFCLTGGTAITEGIGEKITPLEPHPPAYIVVASPGIHVSTPETFARLNAANFNNVPAKEKFLSAYSKKNISQIAKSLYNVFSSTIAHPEIFDLIARFEALGAEGAQMSGTGSSVFAYFCEKSTAEKAISRLQCKAFLCTPVN